MSFFNEIPNLFNPEHIYNNGRSSDLFRSLITFPPTLLGPCSDPGGKWLRVFKDPDPSALVPISAVCLPDYQSVAGRQIWRIRLAGEPELTAAGTVQVFHLIPF